MIARTTRKSIFGLLAALASLFIAGVALAETTITVAVDIDNLSPKVDTVTVACMVCVGDCPVQSSYTPFTGATSNPIDPRLHSFKGDVAVAVPNTTSGDHDHFLCRLELQSNNSSPYTAGYGPPWTLPAPGTPFLNMISGELPLCPVGQISNDSGKCIAPTQVALPRSCPFGQSRVNGICVCPDGKTPVNASCPASGQAGLPSKDAPNNDNTGIDIFKLLLPCPNDGVKQADGSCAPAAPAQAPAASNDSRFNLKRKLLILPRCPDGQLPGKTGLCPAPLNVVR